MIVKQLIKELKKCPQNLEVHLAAHDHSEHESASHANSVTHFVKNNFRFFVTEYLDKQDTERFNDMPDECIVIRG